MGSIDKTAAGRWRVRITTPSGERKPVGTFDTYAEAETHLAAIEAARAGRAVYVVVPHETSRWEGSVPPDLGIKFETSSFLEHVDLRTLAIRGGHPNCLVFVDHFVLERKYAHVLREIHRFDEPGEEQPEVKIRRGHWS